MLIQVPKVESYLLDTTAYWYEYGVVQLSSPTSSPWLSVFESLLTSCPTFLLIVRLST